ncbi:hypothetical protein DFH28DRAFT_847691, partial [Melampsora americana]
ILANTDYMPLRSLANGGFSLCYKAGSRANQLVYTFRTLTPQDEDKNFQNELIMNEVNIKKEI